jgi:hypothetical protein
MEDMDDDDVNDVNDDVDCDDDGGHGCGRHG